MVEAAGIELTSKNAKNPYNSSDFARREKPETSGKTNKMQILEKKRVRKEKFPDFQFLAHYGPLRSSIRFR